MLGPYMQYLIFIFFSYFGTQIFQEFYDFGATQANLIYFKNITNSQPSLPNNSITNSLKIRWLETFGDTEFNPDANELLGYSENHQKFYLNYLKTFIGKYGKANIILSPENTVSLIAINNEWVNFNSFADISLLSLKDEKLFGGASESGLKKEWKTCFHHRINGTIEMQAFSYRK